MAKKKNQTQSKSAGASKDVFPFTLKKNHIYIEGMGLVKKEDFGKKHYDQMLKNAEGNKKAVLQHVNELTASQIEEIEEKAAGTDTEEEETEE